MLYTDTVGLVGWLDGEIGLDGWVYPWGDGSVWMGWNGTEDYGMMILLLCVDL